jgi:hypothetical protein
MTREEARAERDADARRLVESSKRIRKRELSDRQIRGQIENGSGRRVAGHRLPGDRRELRTSWRCGSGEEEDEQQTSERSHLNQLRWGGRYERGELQRETSELLPRIIAGLKKVDLYASHHGATTTRSDTQKGDLILITTLGRSSTIRSSGEKSKPDTYLRPSQVKPKGPPPASGPTHPGPTGSSQDDRLAGCALSIRDPL